VLPAAYEPVNLLGISLKNTDLLFDVPAKLIKVNVTESQN
jgi:hypothetical protein